MYIVLRRWKPLCAGTGAPEPCAAWTPYLTLSSQLLVLSDPPPPPYEHGLLRAPVPSPPAGGGGKCRWLVHLPAGGGAEPGGEPAPGRHQPGGGRGAPPPHLPPQPRAWVLPLPRAQGQSPLLLDLGGSHLEIYSAKWYVHQAGFFIAEYIKKIFVIVWYSMS